ncbi:MAG: preprotein translocase subunit YajC [Clostridiales bacterium]|nr:preprotein translocase subunit YajC [Clostridiales bacterium]
MNNLSLRLLEGETAATGAAGGQWWIMIIYVVVIGAALYFLMIRPQRKRQKKEEQMRSNVQVGDEIVTIGGFYGRVISIKDDTLIIESPSDHSKHKLAKWAIQQNMTLHDDDPAPKK